MASYDLNDDQVIIVIGSGAGGGTLANELCQKGVPVVLLEAGKRTEIDEFENNEWNAFVQLSWLDKRTTSGSWRVATDFPNLPAWICKTVGGSTVHWAGASLRFQEHELKTRNDLWRGSRRQPARLAAHARGAGALLRQSRGQAGRDPDP
jgi:choline dehydrogenase-like flavoprotein